MKSLLGNDNVNNDDIYNNDSIEIELLFQIILMIFV